jgi:hypothetical protein
MLLAAKVSPAEKKTGCADYQPISTKTGNWQVTGYMPAYIII